jgi:Copper amine oxidase N-terminal domain
MLSSTTRRLSALAGTALLTVTLATPALAAGSVSVTVNGQPANLNPAPTERAGRVFVPLRGVFEQLGATVVYQGGVINATGRGHTVSLKIGSQQGTVDGQQQTLDVAPFIIGASTYVPLRFVSQALGATVNYDGANRVVAINTNGGGGGNPNPPAQTVTPAANNNGNGSPVTIGNLLPRSGATIQGNRPTIQATFGNGTVDPNTVHVTFDGRDVTSNAYISDRGITYRPPQALPASDHTVRITGKDTAGASFDRHWSFTSGGGANATVSITNVSPAAGSTVQNSFTVTGQTTPGASVTVQVGVAQQSATNIGQVLGAILGTGGGGNQGVQNTVTADANGHFSSGVQLNAPSGSVLGVIISATEPNYGVSATPVRFNLRVQ